MSLFISKGSDQSGLVHKGLEPDDLREGNRIALRQYCKLLLIMRDELKAVKKKRQVIKGVNGRDIFPAESVVNHVIGVLVRKATDSAHPFAYSATQKKTAMYISEAARIVIKNDSLQARGLTHEHIIPVAAITAHITGNWDDWNEEALMNCFLKYTATAIITHDEHSKLNGELKSIMPDGKIENTFSRYEAVSIALREHCSSSYEDN